MDVPPSGYLASIATVMSGKVRLVSRKGEFPRSDDPDRLAIVSNDLVRHVLQVDGVTRAEVSITVRIVRKGLTPTGSA